MGRRPSSEPALTLEQIIAEAIDCIDERGLEAFTMRALAARMGVYSSAIYWHVSSKARLLGLASARLVSELPAHDEGTSWQQWLINAAHQVRATMHAHANFAPVFGSQMSVDMSAAAPFIETLLAVLSRTGLDDAEIVDAFNGYVGLVMGWVSMELSTEPEPAPDDVDPGERLADQLESFGNGQQPHLSRLLPRLSNRAFMMRWESGQTNPLDSSFDFVVRVFVDGLELRCSRQR